MESQGQRTVVVVDAGGRGAALVDKYAQSEHVDRLIGVPGNGLMGWNTDKPGIAVVPNHRGDLKSGTIKSILDQTGMTADELRNLL